MYVKIQDGQNENENQTNEFYYTFLLYLVSRRGFTVVAH